MAGRGVIIAIDGPSGVGKSSAARALAKHLGFLYLESGGLYRAMAWAVLQEEIDPGDREALRKLCSRVQISVKNVKGRPRIYVGEKDVTDELKTPALDRLSSQISAVAPVRERLLSLQREVAAGVNLVAEGRDMGSVVFPGADFKFYLDASMEARARRRYEELRHRGYDLTLASVLESIQARDRRDMERDLAPLQKVQGAVIIDTSDLTLEAVVDRMLEEIRTKADFL